MKYSSLSELRPLRLDTVAAIGGLLLALALFPLRFLTSQIYIKTVPVILGTACVLYIVSLYQRDDARAVPTLPSSVSMALPSVVFVGLSGLVVLPVLQGERTLAFFGLASVVGTLVIGQIVFVNDRDLHPGLLLLQIVCFAFVFRFAALYTTPGYIGIDIWTHRELVDAILTEQSLSAISDNKHYGSPFYHLLVAASSLLYDVPIRAALYLSVGLVMPLSVLLVYATTNLLVSTRWAVLATALYAFGNHVARWGIHIIPTSLGLVFFLAMLYALIRVMRIEYTIRDFALLLLLSIAVILTHQVSTFIMLVLLLAAFIAQLVFVIGPFGLTRLDTSVFRTKKPVNLVGLVVFNLGLTIFVWSLTPYNQDSFLGTVLSYFTQTLEDSAGFLNTASESETAQAGAEATPVRDGASGGRSHADTNGTGGSLRGQSRLPAVARCHVRRLSVRRPPATCRTVGVHAPAGGGVHAGVHPRVPDVRHPDVHSDALVRVPLCADGYPRCDRAADATWELDPLARRRRITGGHARVSGCDGPRRRE